jgi:hypothetical protein
VQVKIPQGLRLAGFCVTDNAEHAAYKEKGNVFDFV